MAQLNWKYYSLSGQLYLIDVYHGDDSQHLIIFINSEIILIEFSQKSTKTFNFYIENQLIELKLKEENANFEYILTPQLPPNDFPAEKTFDYHFWLPLIILIIAVNLLFIFLF